ncbi:hypothetical protein PV08_11887 [Exophiala spinifera]|uniref:Transcription factor domain-containing protein n=1 Tax=Exophiala spinifera TaxID=91928 RepID=A0A0D1Z9V1_9EURO|nr:uncharacterized protein PV08_11887 [Exophiala spinifera]KIW09787.1 hypothetical protein PV08_11887 [Exophiala spinifera]
MSLIPGSDVFSSSFCTADARPVFVINPTFSISLRETGRSENAFLQVTFYQEGRSFLSDLANSGAKAHPIGESLFHNPRLYLLPTFSQRLWHFHPGVFHPAQDFKNLLFWIFQALKAYSAGSRDRMASGTDTKLLFIPYRPPRGTKQTPAVSGISPQKHAAREYHRKAKLARLARAYANSSQHMREPGTALHAESGLRSQRQAENETLTSRLDTRLDKENAFPFRTEGSHLSSPLDVGVGQLDPFNVLIRPNVPHYVQEMLDHAVSHQWPVFSCSIAATAISEIKHTILASAMRSPAVFYTIVFAGATHNAFAHTGMQITRENQVLRLTYKTHAIRALNQEISRTQKSVSDELLLCMVTLGFHGSGETLMPRAQAANDSPLLVAQNFHFYGHMDWETAHLNAVKTMIKQRGGFHTIEQEFLSNVIALADVIDAFKNLTAPTYPLRITTARLMAIWPYPAPNTVPHVLRMMTTGFATLPPSVQRDPLMWTIETIRDVTIGYDLSRRNDPTAPRHIHVVWARNTLLHDLLRLPDRTWDNPRSCDLCVYEICRLSTLAYMLLVLFPLPRISGLHYALAQRIKHALDGCLIVGLWESHPELFLWATILGGILAEATALRPWYGQLGVKLCQELDLSSWHDLKRICLTFLWYDQDCERLGEEFWGDLGMYTWPNLGSTVA